MSHKQWYWLGLSFYLLSKYSCDDFAAQMLVLVCLLIKCSVYRSFNYSCNELSCCLLKIIRTIVNVGDVIFILFVSSNDCNVLYSYINYFPYSFVR